jgi:thiosulfate/3-mercaptopyruvate sulfurtransferase
MLRWLGQESVAVLYGGWQAWQSGGFPVQSGVETRPRFTFKPHPRSDVLLTTEDLQNRLNDPHFRLFDVRNPARYRGEVEPLDRAAGHIPGAISAPFESNLDENGHFLPPEQLRQRYQALLGGVSAENAAFYCGSGVTSALSTLALMYAGMGDTRLYVGSWSEWVADPSRPIETGG